MAPAPPPLKTPHTGESVWLEPGLPFRPNQPRLGLLSPQWLPESARYDVLSGNQEKAIATLKRIATENGAPMPLGKLIVSRQVSASRPAARASVRVRVCALPGARGAGGGAVGGTCEGV